ncbi:MAG: DNA polymerase II large subunit [uncultured bacterium]|nr:MAG: DNA polymerase II large subunit [uncultured bacterium]
MLHLVDHDRWLVTGIGDDFTERLLHGAQDDLDAGILIVVVALELAHSSAGTNQRHAAACDNAFFNRSTGRVQRIFNARLLFLHFDFGGGTNLDDGNAASQLGHTFLQLFLVVIGSRFFDLGADLLDAGFDHRSFASAVDNNGVFLGDFDPLGLAQILQDSLFQRQAGFFGDHGTAGQNSDIFQHGLATIAKARRLDGNGLQDAADVIHHQRCQGFAIDIFSDDQQRTASLGDLLQNRQQVADVRDLLVVQQNQRIFHQRLLLVAVVDEVR